GKPRGADQWMILDAQVIDAKLSAAAIPESGGTAEPVAALIKHHFPPESIDAQVHGVSRRWCVVDIAVTLAFHALAAAEQGRQGEPYGCVDYSHYSPRQD